jgi:flagellar basal body P-ring protein FlgI
MELTEILRSLLGLLNPEMILELLKIIKPDMATQIDAEIMKLRKEREADRAKFLKAINEMDIPTLNDFHRRFFGN